MERGQYLESIRDESGRLVAAAEAAGLDARVPSCPDWSVADLLEHVGRVQRWQASVVRRRLTEAAWDFEDPPADRAELPGWVRRGSAVALETLAEAPDDAPMWTFVGPGAAAFWLRRQAHEVALHRVDADLAAGTPPALPAALAQDGIEEFFTVVVESRLRERFRGSGETVHLHCTDVDGEWLVRLTADGPEVERAHAKGDVAARGTASDLLLVVRGRLGRGAVEVFGDPGVLDRFIELARL